ncbi:hypothetical protein [Amycolatopsis sp. NPDC059021]|uniref:hypothetical protein n=1 Tax=Amycolatopsis sp. NPDC059021 TaxID=3346704 RepID=UPI00366F0D8A
MSHPPRRPTPSREQAGRARDRLRRVRRRGALWLRRALRGRELIGHPPYAAHNDDGVVFFDGRADIRFSRRGSSRWIFGHSSWTDSPWAASSFALWLWPDAVAYYLEQYGLVLRLSPEQLADAWNPLPPEAWRELRMVGRRLDSTGKQGDRLPGSSLAESP